MLRERMRRTSEARMAKKKRAVKKTARKAKARRAAPKRAATVDVLTAPVKGATHRYIGHVRLDVGRAGAARVKRMIYPVGFRWSKDMRPVTGTELCMHAHAGFLARFRLSHDMRGLAAHRPPLGNDPATGIPACEKQDFQCPVLFRSSITQRGILRPLWTAEHELDGRRDFGQDVQGFKSPLYRKNHLFQANVSSVDCAWLFC